MRQKPIQARPSDRTTNGICLKAIAIAAVALFASALVARAGRCAGDDFYALMDEAMKRMHAGMHAAPSGDVDRDFAAMMIPHHQGAIDMAVLELRHGHDKRLQRLAQSIIVEQGSEIRLMRSVLDDAKRKPEGN